MPIFFHLNKPEPAVSPPPAGPTAAEKAQRATLHFLAQFLTVTESTRFDTDPRWAEILGVSPQKAIQNLVRQGQLEAADLAGRIAYKMRVADLKPLLQERKLPVSGKKEDLIQRLLQADWKTMDRLTAGLVLYRCTETGSIAAQAYLTAETERRERALEMASAYLRQGKIVEAQTVKAEYDAFSVMAPGFVIDGNGEVRTPKGSSSADQERLRIIMQGQPRILKRVKPADLALLRIAAGMNYLFGTSFTAWLPKDLDTGLTMNREAAARMLVFHAYHRQEVEEWLKSGLKTKVTISCMPDACPQCAKLGGKSYSLNKLPELPYEHCTCEMGCRCMEMIDVEV